VGGAPNSDTAFAGSIPEVYEKYLVPLIFEPYALDLAARLAALSLTNLLELAAGTGVVTRRLALELPEGVTLTATDLNQSMLDVAASTGTHRAVTWSQADALQLPFANATFDAVVCQFGAMFFPDKPRAFAEARRVLRPGGVFLFNVWDRIEENEFPMTVTEARCCFRTTHHVSWRVCRMDTTTSASSGGISRLPGLSAFRTSKRLLRAACAHRRASRPWRFARALHCARKSRHAILPDLPQLRIWRKPSSHGASVPAQ